MKIQVTHESGNTEIIEIFDPTVKEGKHLNRINSSDGTEHYFTHDGFYDGYGKMAPQFNEGYVTQAVN